MILFESAKITFYRTKTQYTSVCSECFFSDEWMSEYIHWPKCSMNDCMKISVSINLPWTNVRIYLNKSRNIQSVCLYISMSVCLYVSLSVYLYFVGQSVCMFLCLSVCMFLCYSVCMFLCQSVCMFLCQSVCMFLCQSVCMFLCQSVCMFLCQYVCIRRIQ